MKIAYILTMRKGLPAFVYREIRGLYADGYTVYPYVTKNGRGPYMPEPDWPTRKWHIGTILSGMISHICSSPLLCIRLLLMAVRTSTLVDLLIALAFIKKLNVDKPDVLLCFEGLHGLRIGYYCHLSTSIPIAVIVHAEMLRLTTHREFTRNALMACKSIISPSELNCRRIRDEFRIPHDKVVLNRMAVDIDTFKHDDRLKVLIVGFFAERKGHETLLRALDFLKREDIVVWIAGGEVWGGEMFDVKGFIRQHGLENKVIIFGRVSDQFLHLLLDACDVFCLPCKTPPSGIVEGLPVALMEAMAYEKPVISTYHTGIPELVPEILVEENDYKGVAEAIVKLKNDSELRKKMGARNRKIIEEQFGPQNIKKLAHILLGD